MTPLLDISLSFYPFLAIIDFGWHEFHVAGTYHLWKRLYIGIVKAADIGKIFLIETLALVHLLEFVLQLLYHVMFLMDIALLAATLKRTSGQLLKMLFFGALISVHFLACGVD